jgi:hypothetical protein
LHRLIAAYEAGRSVDLHSVLKYELMPVPGSQVEFQSRSGLLIDSMALVVGIGNAIWYPNV